MKDFNSESINKGSPKDLGESKFFIKRKPKQIKRKAHSRSSSK